jgi:hypothetical protein
MARVAQRLEIARIVAPSATTVYDVIDIGSWHRCAAVGAERVDA